MRAVLSERLAEPIERLRMLDALARPVQGLVDRVIPAGSAAKDLLSGSWLGHALHPVLTDVVVGAWMSSFLLDLMPGRWTRAASDRLVATGIVAAVPTAATGLCDWAGVGGTARRVGVVHASANTVALGLYTGSWLARKRGDRARGWSLSAVGFGVAFFSAYLGGHLVFAQGVGVDRAASEQRPARPELVVAGGTDPAGLPDDA